MSFSNRIAAGRRLAAALQSFSSEQPVVIGLPRGGIVVAAEIARQLQAPLDLCVVRKIGAPWYPELGIGAVAEGGQTHLNDDLIAELGLSPAAVEHTVRDHQLEVEARSKRLRREVPPLEVKGQTVILVDDGIATGGTAYAASLALREQEPRRLVLAVPVASTQALEILAPLVDEVVCLVSTPELQSVGAWYDEFTQVDDSEVLRLVAESRERVAPTAEGREVLIASDGQQLEGTLVIPSGAGGLVLFAHGSGSGRRSPRNTLVAAALQRAGLATLLFDLLSPDESRLDELTAELRFDIGLLARRLIGATDWARRAPETSGLRIGYYGASTGAAAALVAAAALPDEVAAVVSRGGRPDLAAEALRRVRAPTLFVVGGYDSVVLALNREAIAEMSARTELVIVDGASHLFEEPGALEAVAEHTIRFFARHLAPEAAGLRLEGPLG